MRHVLRTGLEMEEISTRNKSPQACNRLDEMQKKVGMIASQDHEAIMEEAGRCDRLEYNCNEDSNNVEDKSKSQ